ncbi:TMEM175 family protein [Secundilactobacillus paracollinoides]|nr:TMEM175 family protein [Secundilactobacillus paracollinoides]KRL81005.1 hypothetical protein FC17_GL002821 [Secundilactobacillus paracollinoides DSM 15502 = JCM 11969]
MVVLQRGDWTSKERIIAFTDAVLAIIMTILVLDLKKPSAMTWAGLYGLRESFFAYALSFFWVGLMWYSHHNAWQKVKVIGNSTVVWTLFMLFFASLFPYTTSLMATHFYNPTAQSLYGIVVILVSFCNVGISHTLNTANRPLRFGLLFYLPNYLTVLDFVIKFVGLAIAVTIYPPAMAYAVLINIGLLLIPVKNNLGTVTRNH